MTALILALGLVCWIVTTILVESELFRPLREYVDRRKREAARAVDNTVHFPPLLTKRDMPAKWRYNRRTRRREVAWRKTAYLVSCHLCAGTWIALALVTVVPVRPFGAGLVGWALAGLLVKAVAHLTLVLHKAGEAVAR